MKKIIILTMFVLALLLSAGCAGGGNEDQQAGDQAADRDGKMKIGLAISTLNNPFFVDLRDGAKAYAEKIGADLVVMDARNDASRQVAQVEDLIQQKVDIILLNPTDSDGLVTAVKSANRADIPVVTLDRSVTSGEVKSHVASDNVAGGRMAAEFIAQQLNDSGKVVVLEGIPGTSAARDRGKGFNDVMENKENIEIVFSQPADFDRARGLSVMENALQAQTDIDAVFAHNDEMALGAIQAIQAANRENIIVVGFDGTETAVQAVKEGRMAATVAQQPAVIGETGVKIAEKIVKGESVDKTIPVNLKLITQETEKGDQQET
ncbi:MAG: ribose ABC transporter substrate-binding protein RbsB [Desulfotomaculum sp.]|nr:ribose ABC transporter substrate-binding protein RbsB [Desulfotomaculum sp.]